MEFNKSAEQGSLPQDSHITSPNSDTSGLQEESGDIPFHHTQIHTDRQIRHSKRLSLNFPVLVPNRRRDIESPVQQTSLSPFMNSPSGASTPQSPGNPVLSDTSADLTTPLTPSSELLEDTSLASKNARRRQNGPKTHGRSHTVAHAEWKGLATPHSGRSSPKETETHLDFLTMLASQERRVLELKEELYRAETELQTLKKQWAIHETNRKKGELRNGGVVKMDVLRSPHTSKKSQDVPQRSKGHTRSATMATSAGLGLGLAIDEEQPLNENGAIIDEETKARRSLIQERFRKRGTTLEDGRSKSSISGRRNGQRIFSGSRHTRTLSLLTSTAKPGNNGFSPDTSITSLSTTTPLPLSSNDSANSRTTNDDAATSYPSLTRSNSGFSRDLNFGKTYKDLASAASRRTIPQGADVLMKHGKVVVDGVRDGLWSFFEDIRQATVGEEAAMEASRTGDEVNGSHKNLPGNLFKTKGKAGVDSSVSKADHQASTEQSFWREFGVDTPRGGRKKSADEIVKAKPRSQKSKQPQSPCLKHTHHEHNEEQPMNKDTYQQLNETTSAALLSITKDTTNSSTIPSSPRKDRISHSSTNSGDSRDSRNPPSLTMSPSGSRHDTDPEDDNEHEAWSWKSDSPMQTRTRPREKSPHSHLDHARKHSDGYEWHALTR